MLPNSLVLYSERTGRVRHVDVRAGLPRECEAALPSGLALLFEKAGRASARRADWTALFYSFPFRTRSTSHYTQTKRSVRDEMSGIVQAVAVSDKVSEIAMEEQAREHEV